MKGFSIKSFLIFAGLFFLLNQSKAQCSFNNFNTGDLTPPGVGLFSETMTAGGGDGYSVTVCAGAQYTATTCFASAFDTYLTVFDAAGNVIGFNDDACGTQSTVTWTSTYSGTAWVFIDRWVNPGNNCAHSGVNQQLRVTQNTGCVTTAPSNCGSPTVVACGGSYTNQTTIGAVNDITTMSCHNTGPPVTPISMPGGDLVYSITVGAGITTIVVNMNNVVDGNDTYAELLFLGNVCSTVNCNTSIQYDIAAGQFSNSTNTWTVSAVGPGTFYFVVDAQSSDGIYLYDIAFDCFASGIAFDNNSACGGAGGDAADGDNNGLRPSVGGSTTLAARTLNGCNTYTICETMYIENPSNWEWLDHVQFNLDPCYTAITPATGFAGNYQPGTWVATYTLATNTIDWEFNHNNPQPLWGDGSGGSYNCQSHTNDFCFTTTIATTCTTQADMQIGIVITDDGIGGAGATVVGTDVEVEDNLFLGTVAPQANAGANDTVCYSVPYTLSGTIGGSASSSTWTTSGTGTFSNATSLTSTYTASAADYGAGFVTITLTTNDPAGPCGPAVDQMTLAIDPPAIISAGPDQTACSLAAINLAGTNTGAPVGTTWSTSGTGTFSNVNSLTSTYTPTAADDALGSVTLTLTSGDPNGFCGPVTDQMVITFDNTNPSLTCPANQTSTTSAGVCTRSLAIPNPVVSDACGYTLSWTSAGATVLSGAGNVGTQTFNEGVTTITYTAVDPLGNSSTCSFTVTINDNQNPTITCPANVSVNANAGSCVATGVALGAPVTADNCGVASVTNNAPASFPLGATTVTWTVTDVNGLTATCNQTVTVTDNQAPTITCPANITTNTAAGVCTASVVTPNPTTTDNCSVASLAWSTAGATVLAGAGNMGTQTFNEGVTTVTYTVTDGAGLTATCSFTVTVNDNQNPTITCPAAQTVVGNASCQGTLGNYVGMAVTADNCGVASVTQAPAAGTVFVGLQVVTLTVTDVNGLTSNCTFNVTVNDVTPPTITCPANQAGTVNASCQFALLNYTGMAVAADNCGAPTVTQSPAAGTNVGVGTTVVTLTATDAAGLTATCTFNVVVTDVTAPTITCPANQTLNVNASCNASLPSYVGMAITADNCGVATVTQAPAVGTVLNGHGTVQVVTLTVTDVNGLTSSCNFNVTLQDVTPPTVTCPANQTAVANASCQFTMIDYTGMVTTSDNCVGAVTVTQSPASGTLVSGTQTVTMTATDAAGNTATCTFQVVVTDNTPPVITCPGNQTGNVNASCQFSIPNYTGMATSTDNCTAVPTITQSPAVGTLVAIGTTVVTLTSTDANGNFATCTFNVVVTDATPPTATCPANQTLPVNGTCNATLPDYTGMVTASDNCGVLSVTQSPIVGTSLSGHGTVQAVTITVTDVNGLTNTCTFNVTLQDVTPPTVTCPANQTAAADVNCQFTMTDYTPMVTTSDNCAGAVTLTQSPAAGSLVSGTQTVTMTATDAAGNISTCTFQVVVTDNAPPVITSGCPANQTVNADASCGFTMTDFTSSITVTDNCSVAASLVVTQSPAVGATIPLGTTTVTLTATDANGNATSCTFDIDVVDNSVPTIVNCPANQNLTITANCDVALPDFTSTLNVTDNCSPAVSIILTQSPVAGTILSGNGTVQTVTLTATDANGNVTTCTFDVTVVDGVNPTFVSCTPDQNETPDVNCQFVLPDYTSLSTVSDNCTPAGSIVVTQSPAVGATINGTSVITLTATDQAGNTATCTFQVILTDGTPPTITSGCPANQTVNADASCGFTMTDFTGSITVTDNCNLAAAITITQSPAVGSTLPIGPTTVTLTATDMNGNATSCTFDITVVDNTVPTFVVCPSNQNLTITANCDAALPDYTSTATVSDNCTPTGTITVTQSPVAGTVISGNGTVQTITLTATDGNGNSATCTFDVTLVDGVNPTIVSCVPNQNEIPDANCQFTLTDYTSLASVTDNCVTSTITVTQNPTAGTVITGTTTITLTATDQDGNAATCTFDVILADGTPPTITSGCPTNQNVNADASCGFSLTDFTGSITVTDNCNTSASVVITQSPVAGTVLPLGTTTVTLTATDLTGNATSCTFDVTVTDVTPPTITCPANITSCDPVVTYIAPIGTDNCSGSVTAQTDVTGLSSGSTFPIGTTTLTYTVTDGAGLTTSCSFDVTVVDITVSPNAGNDVTYCDTDVMVALTGTAAGGGNLTWFSDPALTNVLGIGSSLTPGNTLGTTTYYLSEDISGCNSNPDSVNVTINVCDTLELTIPTGFTPADGDGVNDVWELVNLNAMYPNCIVQVYGRWGGKIFESVGYNDPWDGRYNGSLMPLGSYYFVIDLQDGSDPIKGTVTIIN